MTEQKIKSPNVIMLDNRSRLTVSGVNDVDSFDEKTVVAYTDYGQLTVHGSNLNISKLSTDSGELAVEGYITSLIYTDNQPNESFFKRLFR